MNCFGMDEGMKRGEQPGLEVVQLVESKFTAVLKLTSV